VGSQSLVGSLAETSWGPFGTCGSGCALCYSALAGGVELAAGEGIMGQDQREKMQRQLWLLLARVCGFSGREARYLAFWRWLASQRGETRNRTVLAAGVAQGSGNYGRRVDD
jgi:hypothetical protein